MPTCTKTFSLAFGLRSCAILPFCHFLPLAARGAIRLGLLAHGLTRSHFSSFHHSEAATLVGSIPLAPPVPCRSRVLPTSLLDPLRPGSVRMVYPLRRSQETGRHGLPGYSRLDERRSCRRFPSQVAISRAARERYGFDNCLPRAPCLLA